MFFGEFIKELRLTQNLSLRDFCKKFGHDPSNWSKLERGKLPPPNDQATLEKWASQLGLNKGDAEWYQFFDLASLEKGKIPHDIMSDEELVKALPVFFRTLRGNKPTREELKNLAEILRGS
ncbi:MAG: helix-turn-helix transcriptional regulator [Ignavibacteriales bacterium]|nr:helix-turn-helix transcriptional regulator [Ignavibacteriales bacterium]